MTITDEAFASLTDRVDSIEREVREQRNESLAGKCALLRAYIASHPDDSMKAGMLSILAQLERRVRPLGIALETADMRRIAEASHGS